MAAANKIRKSLVAATFLALAGLGLFAYNLAPEGQVLEAHGLGPVLAFTPGSFTSPLAGEIARDPTLARQEPEDDVDAAQLAQEIKDLRDDLGRVRGNARAVELNEQAYQGYAKLAYYLEDVASGRRGKNPDDARAAAQAAKTLEAVRGFLVQHAQAEVRLTRDPAAQARAQYYAAATLYVAGKARARSVQTLRDLAKPRSRLSSALKRRAATLVALYDLDRGGKAADAAEHTLRQMVSSLPAGAQVAVRLAVARHLAGLSHAGRRVRKANSAYRGQLLAAARRAEHLAARDKAASLAAVITVWRVAEGSHVNWSKPPFSMRAYASSTDVKAVIERAALADWQAGHQAQAIRKYQSLSRSLTGSPMKAAVDLRLLDLSRVAAAKAKNPKTYERALVSAYKSYLDPSVLGDGNDARAKKTATEVARRYAAFVHGELATSARSRATTAERRRTIASANAYLKVVSDAHEIENVQAQIAGLYALSHMYREAVGLYQQLAETGANANARRYWALAIRSQSVLAKWPEDAPWQGARSGPASERETLLNLYQKLGQASGNKATWFVAAQSGLLEISLGRSSDAFTLWKATLKQNAAGSYAAHAAGTMLTAYKRAGSWGELEDLSRLCLARRVRPVFHGQTVDSNAMLAMALLEGGKAALQAGQYTVAVAKLKEFTFSHVGAAHHDEGYFLLASAYRGAGRHDDAIKTLLAFVGRYPHSRYYRQALLEGGDWSAPMAYEENAIFFYDRFITGYRNDAEASRVRTALTELYMGRGLYAQALGVMRQSIQARATDAATRAELMGRVMDVEERYGQMSRAAQEAGQIIAKAGVPDQTKAAAYGLQAQLAAKAGHLGDVQKIQTALAQLSQTDETQEALGQVRLLLAQAQDQRAVRPTFNLALRDPKTTLTKRYDAYKQARAAYLAVCAAGTSSSCAPAMTRLSRLSLDFLKSIEDIAVQDTLAKTEVDSFKSYKQSIYDDAAATSQKADAQALAAVRQGSTNPEWTSAVLWQNTSDWNFDRVTGETGNGYVQWSTSTAPDDAAAPTTPATLAE